MLFAALRSAAGTRADPPGSAEDAARRAHTTECPAGPPHRRLALVTLVVADYDTAIAFFTGTLGFVLVEDTPVGSKRWVVVAPPSGGASLLLARAATPEQAARVGDQTGGRVFLFLETSDFRADHAMLAARGVDFIEPPREERYGIVAKFRDPFGNLWDLVERRKPGG